MGSLRIRSASHEDAEAIAALVDLDAPAGMPRCTSERVQAAMDGRVDVDVQDWGELVRIEGLVACDASGAIVGAGSIGARGDGSRAVLWLHGGERSYVERIVLDALLGDDPSDTNAFSFSTPLLPGLEGLPRNRRAGTHDLLTDAGFVGNDLWLYMVADTPSPRPSGAHQVRDDGALTVIELLHDGTTVATAEVGVVAPDTGVIWWLIVPEEHRGRGFGREALRWGRWYLECAGASRHVLFVDHGFEARDRGPAVSLYESEGFRIVDHLWCYLRSPRQSLQR